ncbi:DUF5309 family protein [bacterium]|nr:DUF5309 family protein [bacterium]
MAFTGFATYDDQNTIQEDIVDLIKVIVPQNTFLNVLEPPEYSAKNTLHYWNEERLSPGTITNSTAIASATAATAFQINALGGRLQAGDLLEFTGSDSLTYREQLQVTSIVGANSIVCSRGIGSIGPSSLAAGGSITLIANAALEGSDFDQNDVTRPTDQKQNTVQIFRKPILVSGTQQAVSHYGIEDMFAHQKANRLAELMRDLEHATLRGVDSATIGSDSVYRRMGGLWNRITTNVATFSTVSASAIDNLLIRPIVENDFYDPDVMVVDPIWKSEVDALQSGRVRVEVSESTYGQKVDYYQSGLLDRPLRVVSNNKMLTRSMAITAIPRVKVVNLQGRAFQYKDLGRTGDAEKGYVVGEYSAEFWNEYGMAKAYSS